MNARVDIVVVDSKADVALRRKLHKQPGKQPGSLMRCVLRPCGPFLATRCGQERRRLGPVQSSAPLRPPPLLLRVGSRRAQKAMEQAILRADTATSELPAYQILSCDTLVRALGIRLPSRPRPLSHTATVAAATAATASSARPTATLSHHERAAQAAIKVGKTAALLLLWPRAAAAPCAGAPLSLRFPPPPSRTSYPQMFEYAFIKLEDKSGRFRSMHHEFGVVNGRRARYPRISFDTGRCCGGAPFRRAAPKK